jgi:protein ImuB
MEIVCVVNSRLTTPTCPGRSGGLRPGHPSPPDPVEAAERTGKLVRQLEAIGAAVESDRVGEAFFVLDGLRGIHGGDSAGVLSAVRRAVGERPRVGVAPTRLAAFAAAWKLAGRGDGAPPQRRDAGVVAPASLSSFVASLRVSILPYRLDPPADEAAELVLALERLGVETMGTLAAISADQIADRFGPLGLEALRLARGEEDPLRPRAPHEELTEQVELTEGTAGRQLDRALGLLVDRLLAAPQRRGRTLLGLRLGALLVAGGSWSVEQGLGRPSASARVLRSVLAPRLELLPGPATALRLRAVGLGPPAVDQLELSVCGDEPRRRRLGDAVREVRSTQGTESLLKVLPIDLASRVPERWAALAPFPGL